jgi:hypothetical protein
VQRSCVRCFHAAWHAGPAQGSSVCFLCSLFCCEAVCNRYCHAIMQGYVFSAVAALLWLRLAAARLAVMYVWCDVCHGHNGFRGVVLPCVCSHSTVSNLTAHIVHFALSLATFALFLLIQLVFSILPLLSFLSGLRWRCTRDGCQD